MDFFCSFLPFSLTLCLFLLDSRPLFSLLGLKAHYDTCACALLNQQPHSCSECMCVCGVFVARCRCIVSPSHRLISGSFIEHQLESINENTSYDFAVHGSFTPRMVHC